MTTSKSWVPSWATHYVIEEGDCFGRVILTFYRTSDDGRVITKPISELAKDLAISDVCQQIKEASEPRYVTPVMPPVPVHSDAKCKEYLERLAAADLMKSGPVVYVPDDVEVRVVPAESFVHGVDPAPADLAECNSCRGPVVKGHACHKCGLKMHWPTIKRPGLPDAAKATLGIAPKPKRSKYHREIKPGVWVDVYDVLGAFSGHYTSRIKPMVDHLLKKLLAGGERGHKDLRQDMVDVRDSAQRAVETIDEWS